MNGPAPAIVPLGEAAITVRLGESASVESAEHSAALAVTIRGEALDGVTDVVAAVASVTVYFDTAGVREVARIAIEQLVAHSGGPCTAARVVATHTIPTRYDGPDLDEVAERVALPRDEVVRRHSGREYHVLAIGFLPGWGYLGMLDESLSLPRRPSPRTRVPAGSVGIMGTQTGIYPRVSPGGWNLIGSTDITLFEASRTPPSLFRTGDRVRFARVD